MTGPDPEVTIHKYLFRAFRLHLPSYEAFPPPLAAASHCRDMTSAITLSDRVASHTPAPRYNVASSSSSTDTSIAATTAAAKGSSSNFPISDDDGPLR